jgi:hypothetical protein
VSGRREIDLTKLCHLHFLAAGHETGARGGRRVAMTQREQSVTSGHLGLVLLTVVGATFAAGASGCALGWLIDMATAFRRLG